MDFNDRPDQVPPSPFLAHAHEGWPARAEFIRKVTGRINLFDTPSAVLSLAREGHRLTCIRYDLPAETGSGFWQMLRLAPDFHLVVTNTHYGHSIDAVAPGEGLVEFHFHLSGRMRLFDASRAPLELPQHSLLVQRQAPGWEVAECIEGGIHDSSVTLYCHPSALHRLFGEDVGAIPAAIRTIFDPRLGGLFRLQLPLNRNIASPVFNLTQQMTEPFQLVRAEGLALQLLSETMMVLSEDSEATDLRHLRERELLSLRRARDQLHRQFTPPPTIAALAAQAGISPTKLKSGFKTVYGKTVHQYADDLRMALARDLLAKRDISIALVSERLGYAYQSSFSLAFSRKFEMNPKDYRNQTSP